MPRSAKDYQNYVNHVITLDTDDLRGLFLVEAATKYKVTMRNMSSSSSTGWLKGKEVCPGSWKGLVLGSMPRPGHEMYYMGELIKVQHMEVKKDGEPLYINAVQSQYASVAPEESNGETPRLAA